MANATPTGQKEGTAQDSVIVHVLGFDRITQENFRVKLQAQATLASGRDPEGLPLGFFLNGILIGKAVFDDFGVADIKLKIKWAALEKGNALVVKVKGMEQAVPIQWDIPKPNFSIEIGDIVTNFSIEISDNVTIELVGIPSVTFGMGQTDEEQTLLRQWNWWDDYFNCERPRHQVKLAAFAISKYPVTQAQWQTVMGNNPSQFKGEYLPVENVSWNDCQEFLKKLNTIVGASSQSPIKFRLPTEAEWECACRAGMETIWPFGNDPAQLNQYAWFSKNSGKQTHPVGQLKPNEWGLFDMLGNVWEWCQDCFDERYYANSPQENPLGPSDGQFRVLRGGGWNYGQNNCRSVFRNRNRPDNQGYDFGLRVVVAL